MSDDPQTMTIDRRTYTYMTNTIADEAEAMITALVEKGVPGKLRPGRSYIICAPEIAGNTREARRKRSGAISLGICEIWMEGEIEEADRTYRPSPPTL